MNAEIDITSVVIMTDRLTLRPWEYTDLDDFYEYASVEGVGEMAGWSHHKSKDESKTILNLFIRGKKTFALVYEGKVIGSLGIEKYKEADLPELDEKRGREIGFVLSKAYWGRGLMTEAVKAVIDYLFDTVGLDFIVCGHFTDNPRSARVQQKCGFRYIKDNTYQTTYGELKPNKLNILFKYDK